MKLEEYQEDKVFNLFNSEEKKAAVAEQREKDFIRERDAYNHSSSDDATYLETQQAKSDLIRWQQEFNEELENLQHELLSEVKTSRGWERKTYKEYDEHKNIWITKEIPALCTADFAEKLIRMAVKPWMNKNAINSNLDQKTILKMLRNTHNEVAGAISDSWGMNGVTTLDDANQICRMIKNYVDPAAYRSLNGWTKRTDSTMIKRVEAEQTVIPRQEKSGLFGMFKT